MKKKSKSVASSPAVSARLLAPVLSPTNPASFRDDLSQAELRKLTGSRTLILPNIFTVESLSPLRTVGVGRTNITLVGCNTFQTDATPARAFFDRTTTTRAPGAQMHFDPAAYGIGPNAALTMSFSIRVPSGSVTFSRIGDSQHTNPGTITVAGNTKVTLTFKASSPLFGLIQQASGSAWEWISTQIIFIPILQPAPGGVLTQ